MTGHWLLPHARLAWSGPEPHALDYDDVYANPGDALNEKRAVFVNGHNLDERWAMLDDGDRFVIGETGFGFGINFLLTLARWRSRPRGGARLHYVAIEGHPVRVDDLRRRLDHFELDGSEVLTQCWPSPSRGCHRLHFGDDVDLTLAFMDANAVDRELDWIVDAWYLDGFSPHRNPDFWSPDLFAWLKRSSRPGTTLSTYTSAGFVRRALTAAGFEIRRIKGYGNKPQMLRGSVDGTWTPARRQVDEVVIHGAGLAGISLFKALHRRGVVAHLVDEAAPFTAGASAMWRLTSHPQLAIHPDARSLFSLAASIYMRTVLAEHMTVSGMTRVALDDATSARLERLIQAFAEAPDIVTRGAEATADRAAVRWPMACYVTNEGLKAWAADITTVNAAPRNVPVEVWAIGAGSLDLPRLTDLPLHRIGGRYHRYAADPGRSDILRTTATLYPGVDGHVVVGATYEKDPEVNYTALLHARAQDAHPSLTGAPLEETQRGVRCATRDRMAVAGVVGSGDDTLTVLTGLGSHGLTLAPLLGEYVASLLVGDISPLPRSWRALVDPARFERRTRA